MNSRYSRDLVKVSVGKMLQTIGWHSVQTIPLEILTDILANYLSQMGKLTNDYANEFGCTEPNLDHLGLVFRDFHINLPDLEEYVIYVDFAQPPTSVTKYPISKEDHLNFLKPGSKEVVTRPVHIHEHLPPMFTIQEVNENENEVIIQQEEPKDTSAIPVFKRPAEISPGETFKRPRCIDRLLMEEEGRPTREISSVMMTTSGYISPAREGKLPESRTPLASLDTMASINSTSAANNQSLKPNKIIRKVEKKREKVGKELFKPLEDKFKKVPSMKDIAKLKQVKIVNNSAAPLSVNNALTINEVKVSAANKLSPINNKVNKALAAARLKTEKLNTTITPIPMKPTPLTNENVDKLFTEPDKKKVNILKKISNVKNDKLENKIMKIKEEMKQESRESSPVLVIDETVEQPTNKIHHISNDITIELIDTKHVVSKTPEKTERPYFYDDSPPGTPLTPKTPEMISHSPPLTKEKRKRKDKSKVKKVQKIISPNRMDADIMEIDMLRPKTPEAQIEKQEAFQQIPPPMPFPFGFSTFGPGLIPSIFSSLLPPPFRAPVVHPSVHMNFLPPVKQEEPTPPAPRPKTPVEKTQIPQPPPKTVTPPIVIVDDVQSPKTDRKNKEHKKEKKDKIKKKNKKDRIKDKSEKKKLKEEKKDKEKVKKEKKDKRKEKEFRENDVSIPKLTLKLGSPSPHAEGPDTRKLNIKPIIKKEEEESSNINHVSNREMSPELAKISALVTGQPKPKSTNQTSNMISNDNYPTSSTDSFHNQVKKTMFKPVPKKEVKREPIDFGLTNTTPTCYIDSDGNEVWICPGCGRQDDGSPMIGCDDCDAWYHWVCVGIQVPPDDNENWYCRHCLVKKQEVLQTDKKKKRKKREKKEH